MAIDSVAVLVPPPLPPMRGGVEIFVNEAHNTFGVNTAVGDGLGDFRGVNVLVSFATDERERQTLWPLRHVLAFGRFSVAAFDGFDWPKRLLERLKSVAAPFATVTVFAGCGADLVAETVQPTIDAIRAAFGETLAVLVFVSATPYHFASLHRVTGFARGVGDTTARTASHVFLALASFSAPKSLNGIDVLDLLPVLGTADSPTVVAQALWLRPGGGRLLAVSQADEAEIAAASYIVAIPFVRTWGWTELRRFQSALRSAACTEPIIFATNDTPMEGVLPAGIVWVPILCAAPSRNT